MTPVPSASQRTPQDGQRYDVDGLLKDLGDIPVVTEPGVVRRKSRDYFWYSPILNKSLHGKSADVLVALTEMALAKTARGPSPKLQ